jgi:hypothetical protein
MNTVEPPNIIQDPTRVSSISLKHKWHIFEAQCVGNKAIKHVVTTRSSLQRVFHPKKVLCNRIKSN